MNDLRTAIVKLKGGPAEFQIEGSAPVTVVLPARESGRDSLAAAFDAFVVTRPVIGQVVPNQPAERAGLKANDRVLSVNGKPVQSWQEFAAEVEKRPGQALQLVLDRAGSTITTTVTPDRKTLANNVEYGRLGVQARVPSDEGLPRERVGVIGAAKHGFTQTWTSVATTVDFVRDLFTGKTSARNVGGPIQIGQLSGRIVRLGLEPFLLFIAYFSVNLAVLNLLPIPVLDGGHLMFLLVEGVRGRALSLEQRMRLSQVGFVIVLAIMVWAVANDVLKLFGL
jgi:regulator of sigma E protease